MVARQHFTEVIAYLFLHINKITIWKDPLHDVKKSLLYWNKKCYYIDRLFETFNGPSHDWDLYSRSIKKNFFVKINSVLENEMKVFFFYTAWVSKTKHRHGVDAEKRK